MTEVKKAVFFGELMMRLATKRLERLVQAQTCGGRNWRAREQAIGNHQPIG